MHIRRLQPPLIRPLETSSPFALVPSWLASVVVHLLLFLSLAAGMRGCDGTSAAGPTEQDRVVGIYVSPDIENVDSTEVVPEFQSDEKPNLAAADLQPQDIVKPDPPAELRLPSDSLTAIGIGAPADHPDTFSPDIRKLVTPNGVQPPTESRLGKGETSFLDIRDTGTSFVYLIDSSGSMYGRQMQFARAQLKASLQRLDRTQRFQIIFYANDPYPMSIKRSPGRDMYWATELNVAAAARLIDQSQPNAGTDHKPAIMAALKLRPEVLYLLTDADEPFLSTAQMKQIAAYNRGNTRIHCIEFGKGPELSIPGWLKELASRNGGKYRYRDVTRLPR